MTADGAEAVLTVAPVLAISGRVTDAETGQPLATFRVVQGLVFANNPRIAWLERNAAEFRGGRYTVRHSEPYAGYAVRIEAPGYKPAESRVFRPGEVAPTFDFAMARAAAADLLTGFVYRPDGRPAAGADVALATPGASPGLRDGAIPVRTREWHVVREDRPGRPVHASTGQAARTSWPR